ncbi:hypothetical protein ACO22_06080 [Paracoccidioides brasiliensis]|uniref:Uncharacterized protein n=1 Tax=Paracoccidioides brasiliensis TaxID=121759 RepID=A0A1D2J8K1_PARBR|nr:hypothetical protein ACO22_06080 [Paracoccidioides brasiliensis]
MSLPNIWHHRKVAETAARSCEICYKPSSSVLITPDNKASIEHANDRGFCSPIVDEEEVASRKKKEELDKEIEKVKQEYEEKMNRKKLKDKEKKDGIEKEDKKAEKEKDDKGIAEPNDLGKYVHMSMDGAETHMDDTPRVFALHKNFYQMRIDRIRKKEIARRNTECLKNPDLFPSTPKTDL